MSEAYLVRRIEVALPPPPISVLDGGEIPPHGPSLRTLEVEQWSDRTYRHTTAGTPWTEPITRTVAAELFEKDRVVVAFWLHTGDAPVL